MFKKLKDITTSLLLGANITTVLLLLFLGYNYEINPRTSPLLSTLGVLFPVAVVLCLGFLLFWLFTKKRYALLSLAGFIACYVPMRTYAPVNIPKAEPLGAIKILTYNIHYTPTNSLAKDSLRLITDYIRRSKADIVCLQEGVMTSDFRDSLKDTYPYIVTAEREGRSATVPLLSKFPILSWCSVDYPSQGNMTGAYKVLLNEGDTIIVVNNHLECTRLSYDERTEFSNIVKGRESRQMASNGSKNIFQKLARANKIRARQADSVAAFVERYKRYPVILCGDFNDNPISYTRHTIAERLTDCYVETATGPGFSFNMFLMFVRIDNVMCSKDFMPYSFKVDKSITASDHYPMTGYLERRK